MPKNPKTKLQFISSYFDTITNSHNNLNIETIANMKNPFDKLPTCTSKTIHQLYVEPNSFPISL
jgi:hypothetical protein